MEHLTAGSEAVRHDATLNLFKHHWKLVLVFGVFSILMYFHLILLLICCMYCMDKSVTIVVLCV